MRDKRELNRLAAYSSDTLLSVTFFLLSSGLRSLASRLLLPSVPEETVDP